MNRFTDKNGRKKPMTSSVEAYRKLAEYEDAEEQKRILPKGYSCEYQQYTDHFIVMHNGFIITN